MEELSTAVTLIKKFEGLKLNAYYDLCHVLSIGYGTTHGVRPGMYITQEQAETMLMADCSDLSARIRQVVRVSLTNNQLCALISFCYNVGYTAFFHSTLLTKINEGLKPEDCATEFLKWDHAAGKVVEGLTNRRQSEARLFQA